MGASAKMPPHSSVICTTDAIKIEADQTENTDWVKILNESLTRSSDPLLITIELWEAGEYPITTEVNTTAPIYIKHGSDVPAGKATVVFNHGFTIGGSITVNGVNIKAGDVLDAPVFTLLNDLNKKQDNGYSNFGSIKFSNLTVSNLKTPLVQGAKGIQISEIETSNSKVYMAGAISGGDNAPAIYDFQQGGVVAAWSFVNSTLDAGNNVIFSTAGGEKVTAAEGVTTQTLDFSNSTIINPAKNVFQHSQDSQDWLCYILKNNLVVVNKDEPNFVAGMNGGNKDATPTWQISGNAFQIADGDGFADVSNSQSTGDTEEPVENSVCGSMSFNNLEIPDFGGTLTLVDNQTIPSTLGDPRWKIEYIGGSTDGIKNVYQMSSDNSSIYNLNGQKVKSPTKGIYIANDKKVIVN